MVLAAAAGGLVLLLGLTERQRSFAIIAALGAGTRQLRGLVTAETAVLTIGGLVTGAVAGCVLSQVLVAVLTRVYDPPPAAVTVPWADLTVTALVRVSRSASRRRRPCGRDAGPDVAVLREL